MVSTMEPSVLRPVCMPCDCCYCFLLTHGLVLLCSAHPVVPNFAELDPYYILHYTYGDDYTLEGAFTPGKVCCQTPAACPPGILKPDCGTFGSLTTLERLLHIAHEK
jgi:hypothetical protein